MEQSNSTIIGIAMPYPLFQTSIYGQHICEIRSTAKRESWFLTALNTVDKCFRKLFQPVKQLLWLSHTLDDVRGTLCVSLWLRFPDVKITKFQHTNVFFILEFTSINSWLWASCDSQPLSPRMKNRQFRRPFHLLLA